MSDKKFIFNDSKPTSAISFNIPKKDNLDLLEFVTLKGQDSYEVTGLQEIHYKEILDNHDSLIITNGNDYKELTDEELLEVDLDSLNLTDEEKQGLETRIQEIKSKQENDKGKSEQGKKSNKGKKD